MDTNVRAASYSRIASRYDDRANENSFWGELARRAYGAIVLKPTYHRIVDVGCGTGIALNHLQGGAPSSASFVGIEPSEQMRLLAQQRNDGIASVEIREGRFEEMPLADASVDYLYSIWAFHWASDPRRAAEEIRRVLRADGEIDLWFVGMNTGREFARKTAEVLTRYVDLETRLRAASMMTSFDRRLVDRLFSFLDVRGLTIEEETTTHYDTLDAHWAWQIRSEAHYSVIPAAERSRFDAELRSAIESLGDERGIPYSRHSFHVRYRHVDRAFFAIPPGLDELRAATEGQPARRPMRLCTLAAESHDEIRRGMDELRSHLEREYGEEPLPGDVCASMGGGADLGSHRLALVAASAGELARGLRIAAEGRVPALGARGVVAGRPVVAFMFTGMGDERTGMGRELFETCPVFRCGIEQCARISDDRIETSLVELFCQGTACPIEDDTVAKVALFALQYSLFYLWRSWGVHPRAVVGHSLGEFAAACVAGVFSVEDAIRLLVGRGRAMKDHAVPGSMCAVQANVDRIMPYLSGRAGRVVISALNAPEGLVLSGDTSELSSLSHELAAQGIRTTALRTAHAFHSPLMLPVEEPFRRVCESIRYSPPRIPFISTVDGGLEADIANPGYWVRHMLQPVHFTAAIATLQRYGVSAYVELGPRATLTNMTAQCLGASPAVCMPSLGGQDDDWLSLLACLGALHVQGVDIDSRRFASPGSHWAERLPILGSRTATRVPPRSDRDGDEPAALLAGLSTSSSWVKRLEETPSPLRLQMARRFIRMEVVDLLGREVGEHEDEKGLMDLGLDSLRSVALARRLSDQVQHQLSETITFSYPSIDALARTVLEVLLLEAQEEALSIEPREQGWSEPVAIVGIGCRFPGGASSPEAFWELLDGGRDAVQPLEQRWALVGAQPSEDVPRWAGLLTERVDGFDAMFFGIAPREARSLDPQHRLVLEVGWEAIEDAGLLPRSLEGSRTGVFLGACFTDYAYRVACQPSEEQDAYGTTGNLLSIAAGRLSYTLGLQGPCLIVDTACSSSLTAIHLACRSLRARESDLALAGGVNLLLSAATTEALAHTQALSPDGRCSTFDASANGYVRGEGCGLVLLKRLSDARRDGDRIWAVIRGSAVNQDGRSTGLTAPNGLAQEALLREALESAGVEPEALGYIETHGTGTSLGDPIEVEALRAVVGPSRRDGARCVLGAVKTNLGHLEAAAGVAGLIKGVLALRHERIPKNLNFRTLNPRIRLAGTALSLATEPVSWPRGARPRFAGVSAFGMSGTNAHVVLEEAPAAEPRPAAPARPAELVVLSAKSGSALWAQAGRLWEHLSAHPEQGLGDVAYSLATTRSAMEQRLAVVASSREELQTALGVLMQDPTLAGAERVGSASSRGKLAFLCAGQGSQEAGMGHALHGAWPAFREAFDRCVVLFDRELERPLRQVMWSEAGSVEGSLLDQTAYTQPALFALSYGLFALWRSWGVEPELVAGHSIGELVAACVAGLFSLEDGVRLVAARGRLMQGLPAGGAMVSIAAPEAEVARAVGGHAAWVSIAAVNGPEQVVIAGDEGAVEAIRASFAERGVRTKALRVSHAFHSPHMDAMLEGFGRVAARVTYRSPTIPVVSNVSGAVGGEELRTAGYWVEHVRKAVRFADGVRALHGAGASRFVEVGLGSTLVGLVPACLSEGAEPLLLSSLRSGRGEAACVLEALGGYWSAGGSVDWAGVFPEGGRRVSLPTYAWQRERHWVESNPESRGREAVEATAEVYYRVEWPEVARAPRAELAGAGHWLVMSDGGGVSERVASALTLHGRSCTVLRSSGEVAAVAEQVAAAVAGREDWQGVVYLGGLDAVVEPGASAHEVGARTLEATATVLGLLRVLARRAQPPRLWVVTRGACAVGGEVGLAPCQGALWGLGRVVALEHAGAWGGLIDLEPEGRASEVEAVVTELLSPDTEDQLALRQGRRHAARLTLAAPEGAAEAVVLRAEGSYLVTGGLGGLGQHVARWLVERGAGHVVLTGRRGLATPGAGEGVAALEAQGARVTVAAVDVADAEAMATLVAAIEPPLRGVVHAAGVVVDRLLAHKDESQLVQVLRPKVEGAWILHALTCERRLDFFVLFSSFASVSGLPGQGAYAAANAFLDSLAALRHGRGLPALSIGWGPWAEGTMGSPAQREHYGELGIRALATSPALAAMERLMGSAGVTQRMVVRVNWEHLASARAVLPGAARGHLLDRLLMASERVASPSPPAAPRNWRGLSVAQARTALQELVHGTVGRVLGFVNPAALDAGRGFAEQGLDSLMAVQIRNQLERALGVPLSATLAFNHPTVERLVKHLLSDVLELEDRKELGTARSVSVEEPIALVSAACRFPGGAEDLEGYWRLLMEGVVTVTEVPADRWSAADWYDADPDAPGCTYVAKGSFLREVKTFDAGFFRISPREAASLDPQQRLLLEVSWEALERAGQDPSALRESATGVFVGVGSNEYLERQQDVLDEALGLHVVTGNAMSFAAGRLSFVLGLRGPSLSVDTACSSSLVALHLGCQSLRQGECDRALVGGVNVLLSPRSFVMMARMRALSPDGRCKPFSAEADGFGRAEGCAVVVLKRLTDAQRDGDRILAVIRGTAVNHDGASSGVTVPNGPAQQALLRQALAQAGVAGSEVDFVECHGTGTALGDPIEVQAVGAVYGAGRAADRPLCLGAAKANVGHLEAAAGLVGVLKAALAFKHEQIPGQPGLGELNRHIGWEALPVTVPREARPWPRGGRRRLAGVSAFGMSGTNAHVVLEEAPAAEPRPAAPARPAELVVLSAKSASALWAQAGRLWEHLSAHPEQGLGDVAYSLATTRSAMEQRLAVVASSREELQTALGVLMQDPTLAGAERVGSASSRGKLAFLCAGQGSQEAGMGHALHGAWPAFREAFDRCVVLFDRELERPLRQVMWSEAGSVEGSLLDQTAYTQPALFALSYGLFALWRSWGVEPELVAGHSIGELVAACVAGLFSLEDGVRLVAARGRLMQGLPAGGAMVSIAAPEAEVALAVAVHAAWVSIAAVNGPEQVVIAGDEGAVEAIRASFAERGVRTKALRVSHAFHSPHMDAMLEGFGRVAARVTYRSPTIPVVSNVSGAVGGEELRTAGYWVEHVRKAVRFADGVRALHGAGANRFVEVGPGSTLVGLVPACLSEGAEPLLLSSLRSGRGEAACVLEALGGYWSAGGSVDWAGVFPEGGRRVSLPTYAWQREPHWVEGSEGTGDLRLQRANRHALRSAGAEPAPEAFYRLEWREGPRMEPPGAWPPGGWVVVAAQGSALGAALAARLDRCVRTETADLAATLDNVGPLAGVVCLVEARAEEDASGVAQRASTEGLSVVQVLRGQAPVRLWWVTSGAVAVHAGEEVAVGAAPVWGLGRTVMQEHPELGCTLVDVRPGAEGLEELLEHRTCWNPCYIARLCCELEPR